MGTQQIFVKLKSKEKQHQNKNDSNLGEFIGFQLLKREQLQENYCFMLSQTTIKVEGQNKITDMQGLERLPPRPSLSRYTQEFLAKEKGS